MEEKQTEASEGCSGHTFMVSNNQIDEGEIDGSHGLETGNDE